MSPLLRQVIAEHRTVLWLLLGALGLGVAACGVAAAVASFLWLTVLAVASGWTVAPWLLPLCVDALAWSGLLLWILVRSRYALGVAVGALGASVAGNVAAHLLPGTSPLQVEPWVAGLVAAVPPVSFGLVVHLVPLFLGSLAWLAESTPTPPTGELSSGTPDPEPDPVASGAGSGAGDGASGSPTAAPRTTAASAAASLSIPELAGLLAGHPDFRAGMSERALRELVNKGLKVSASRDRMLAARDLAASSANGDRADVARVG